MASSEAIYVLTALVANLNREWGHRGIKGDPDYYEAPTMVSWGLLCAGKKMDETGVDVSLDFHFDGDIHFNFIARAQN